MTTGLSAWPPQRPPAQLHRGPSLYLHYRCCFDLQILTKQTLVRWHLIQMREALPLTYQSNMAALKEVFH